VASEIGVRRCFFHQKPGGREAAEEETMTPALLQFGFWGVIGRKIVIITLFERSMMMILLA
jgi:hypothetical protein